MSNRLLLIPLALTLCAGGYALAQSAPEGIDLDAIRARAHEQAADAEALAQTVRAKAGALAEQAKASQAEAHANRAAYAANVSPSSTQAALDLDAMIATQAEAETASLGASPRFIAFASLSMPEASLKALVRDMTRAGGVTVLRGFPQGNAALFKTRLAAIWSSEADASALGIDPRLFRAFHIEVAPSFVMLGADFSPCDGFDCSDSVPPHDRVAGNITVHQALDTFAAGGGPGASLARQHLARLEETRP